MKEDELSTLQEYVHFTRSTAIYPRDPADVRKEAMYLCLGMAGETGEVCELVKKWFRDGGIDKDQCMKEIGDVLWYWSRLCDTLGFDPEEVMQKNQEKLMSRRERGTLQGSGNDR